MVELKLISPGDFVEILNKSVFGHELGDIGYVKYVGRRVGVIVPGSGTTSKYHPVINYNSEDLDYSTDDVFFHQRGDKIQKWILHLQSTNQL